MTLVRGDNLELMKNTKKLSSHTNLPEEISSDMKIVVILPQSECKFRKMSAIFGKKSTLVVRPLARIKKMI